MSLSYAILLIYSKIIHNFQRYLNFQMYLAHLYFLQLLFLLLKILFRSKNTHLPSLCQQTLIIANLYLIFNDQCIYNRYLYLPLIMKNPFDNLPDSDQEDKSKFVQVGNQAKNTTQKKPSVQQPKPEVEKRDTRPNVNDNIVVNQRENTKNHKSDREQKPSKVITDHRAHDRQSGTGRVSEPRKGGGGRGGIGNMKDQLNQDKILGKVKEQGEGEQELEKEPQPEALTLEEYYAKQGLDISNLDKKRERPEGNKDAPQADWVAKEKLQFVNSKQNNVLDGETKKVAVLKNQPHKIDSSAEQELLGFTSTAPKKQNQEETKEREPREARKNKDSERGGNEKGGRKYEEKKQAPQAKLVINEEDFPSL